MVKQFQIAENGRGSKRFAVFCYLKLVLSILYSVFRNGIIECQTLTINDPTGCAWKPTVKQKRLVSVYGLLGTKYENVRIYTHN